MIIDSTMLVSLEAALLKYAFMTPQERTDDKGALAKMALAAHGSAEAKSQVYKPRPVMPTQRVPREVPMQVINTRMHSRVPGADGPGVVAEEAPPY